MDIGNTWRLPGIGEEKILVIDYEEKIVHVDDKPIRLTGKEYGALIYLMRAPNRVCTIMEIFESLYHDAFARPQAEIVKVFLCKLRKKLTATGLIDPIETVWGRGYLFAVAPQTSGPLPERGAVTAIRIRSEIITLQNLPLPDARWTPWRKEIVVAAVRGNLITFDAALARYRDLSATELTRWIEAYQKSGRHGLKISREAVYL